MANTSEKTPLTDEGTFYRLVYRRYPAMIVNRTFTEHLGKSLWLGRGFLDGQEVAYIADLDAKVALSIPVEAIDMIARIVSDWRAH